jgi:hypothetical protein
MALGPTLVAKSPSIKSGGAQSGNAHWPMGVEKVDAFVA